MKKLVIGKDTGVTIPVTTGMRKLPMMKAARKETAAEPYCPSGTITGITDTGSVATRMQRTKICGEGVAVRGKIRFSQSCNSS